MLNVNSMLRVAEMQVNLIFISERTHHLSFTGDKKEWAVYMTIGNQSVGQTLSAAITGVS